MANRPRRPFPICRWSAAASLVIFTTIAFTGCTHGKKTAIRPGDPVGPGGERGQGAHEIASDKQS